MNTFEQFNTGSLSLPQKTIGFTTIPWSKHPTFIGVEMKNILTSKDTNGEFSFHLVHIAANKEIGFHVHKQQLETHEVIAGSGTCTNNQSNLTYTPGVISIFPKNIEHKIVAGPDGLYLFAKFFPALC